MIKYKLLLGMFLILTGILRVNAFEYKPEQYLSFDTTLGGGMRLFSDADNGYALVPEQYAPSVIISANAMVGDFFWLASPELGIGLRMTNLGIGFDETKFSILGFIGVRGLFRVGLGKAISYNNIVTLSDYAELRVHLINNHIRLEYDSFLLYNLLIVTDGLEIGRPFSLCLEIGWTDRRAAGLLSPGVLFLLNPVLWFDKDNFMNGLLDNDY